MEKLSKRRYICAREKVSRLIRIALADLEKCEASEEYTIYMETWHSPNSHCAVCFAGAVMAQTIGISKSVGAIPHQLHPLVEAQLLALNYLRAGFAQDAWNILLWRTHGDYPLSRAYYSVPEYDCSPAGFKRAMRAMADRFEKAGY